MYPHLRQHDPRPPCGSYSRIYDVISPLDPLQHPVMGPPYFARFNSGLYSTMPALHIAVMVENMILISCYRNGSDQAAFGSGSLSTLAPMCNGPGSQRPLVKAWLCALYVTLLNASHNAEREPAQQHQPRRVHLCCLWSPSHAFALPAGRCLRGMHDAAML
jgi:hypothetical protein